MEIIKIKNLFIFHLMNKLMNYDYQNHRKNVSYQLYHFILILYFMFILLVELVSLYFMTFFLFYDLYVLCFISVRYLIYKLYINIHIMGFVLFYY
jgi:hypothetical protein